MSIESELKRPAHMAGATLGMEYGDLRAQPAAASTGTGEARPTAQPVSDPTGFNWPSAAAGAAARA